MSWNGDNVLLVFPAMTARPQKKGGSLNPLLPFEAILASDTMPTSRPPPQAPMEPRKKRGWGTAPGKVCAETCNHAPVS
jgi:hypothetical protein